MVHYFVQNPHRTEGCKRPFTLFLENEFKQENIMVHETSFQFGVDEIDSFLEEHEIKKDHFLCFDEIVCHNYTKNFVDGLRELKNHVSALWLAIGGKSTRGRFGINGIEKAGFVCPKMKYPLRNPLKIAKYAHNISQLAPENNLGICLRNEINITQETNIVEGTLIKVEEIFPSYQKALEIALGKIPSQKFSLIFLDTTEEILEACIFSIYDNLKRTYPQMITKVQDYFKYQKWLCNAKKKNDLFIVGVDHNSNGIQTSIVVYVSPEHCTECGYSSEDPVITSRATAMLIIANFVRSSCPNCNF